ncbi:hypothetical protein EAG_15354 [Camponotus floridanus]|uniref:Uncharacterized protein n=1 Tax=Camponotus floridanus TaxID=104421 RepID=E2AYV4_CAMFO|nr:hypothetical protein EAG_15354 [Camponotus floridanus]
MPTLVPVFVRSYKTAVNLGHEAFKQKVRVLFSIKNGNTVFQEQVVSQTKTDVKIIYGHFQIQPVCLLEHGRIRILCTYGKPCTAKNRLIIPTRRIEGILRLVFPIEYIYNLTAYMPLQSVTRKGRGCWENFRNFRRKWKTTCVHEDRKMRSAHSNGAISSQTTFKNTLGILLNHVSKYSQSPESHVKIPSNFLNETPYILLHILVAFLKTFLKHYNKCFGKLLRQATRICKNNFFLSARISEEVRGKGKGGDMKRRPLSTDSNSTLDVINRVREPSGNSSIQSVSLDRIPCLPPSSNPFDMIDTLSPSLDLAARRCSIDRNGASNLIIDDGTELDVLDFALLVRKKWPTYLSMVVESVLLSDLIRSLRSAGHVNGELIRIDWHWSLPWSRFGSRAGQQRAHNQQRHPEDHVVDDE